MVAWKAVMQICGDKYIVWKEKTDLGFKSVRSNVANQVLLLAHAGYENNETVRIHSKINSCCLS